jgi:hypothetical protein
MKADLLMFCMVYFLPRFINEFPILVDEHVATHGGNVDSLNELNYEY